MALLYSDPGISFTAAMGGKPVVFSAVENQFRINQRIPTEITLTLGNGRYHGAVRARFTICPEGIPECKPKEYFRLAVPAGERVLRFPQLLAPLVIEVHRTPLHPFYLLFLAALAGAAALAYSGVARLVAIPTLLSSGLYFSVTMGRLRALDLSGHITHVERIARDGLLVNANACWECFHPPLYYSVASWLLGRPLTLLPSGTLALQGFAVALHLLSVPLIVGCLEPFLKRKLDLFLLSSLVALWPAAILQSVRIGNDVPLNFAVFLCLFLLVRRFWLPACAVAAAALLVKSSAIVVVTITAAYGIWRSREIPRKTLTAGGILLGLGILAAQGMLHLKQYDPLRLDSLPSSLAVHNTAWNLTVLEPVSFVTGAFANPWISTTNRNHLQNYFWKTSLFGEWTYQFPGADLMGRVLSAILLALLLLVMAISWRTRSPSQALPALALFFSFFAIYSYRILHPFACNADFRFVYPSVVLGLAWLLAGERSPRVLPVMRATIVAFLGLSQLFLLSLWFFESA